jgi:hypothetical protein
LSKRRSKEKINQDRKEIIKLILQEDKYKDRYLEKHKDKNFYREYKNIFFKDINESLIKNIENTDYVNFISSYKNFLIDNKDNIEVFENYLNNFEKLKEFFNKIIESESSYYKNKFLNNFGEDITIKIEEYNQEIKYNINFLEFIKLTLKQNNKEKKDKIN